MHSKVPLWLIIAPVLLGLGACEIKPPTSAIRPVRPPGQVDWKRSAMWLFATEGSASGPEPECALVYERLQAEARCQGALCKKSALLAAEWVDKCAKHAAAHAAAVRSLQQALQGKAQAAPTPCAQRYELLAEQKCAPAACADEAQKWATECGETEASPLGVRIVERAVRRRTGEPVELDARGCRTLQQQVREGSQCADEDACRQVWPTAAAYRSRCEDEQRRPDAPTAIALLAITVGAGRQAEPVTISGGAEALAAESVPLVLADGSGAILGLCHQRPVDLDGYLALRQRCVGTTLTLARMFVSRKGERALQVGRYLVPERFGPPTPYGWLQVTGERARLEQERAAALQAALDQLPAATDAATLAKLVQVIDDYGPWLEQSQAARQALRDHDAKLTPLFAALARAKVAAAPSTVYRLSLLGFHFRAQRRPFADVTREAAIELGAATRASWLDLTAVLPRAMAAYRNGLEPLQPRLRVLRKPTPQEQREAEALALDRARACAAAQNQVLDAEQELTQCVFGTCDDARVTALRQQWHQARTSAADARRELDLAVGPLGSSADLWPQASEQGCERLRW